VGDAQHWWHRRVDDWHSGERHLVYTIIACAAIMLVGLIVVPLSIPEPLPGPERSQVLGERYLRAIPVNAADRPTLDQVEKAYGDDGGKACTAKLADAYQLLVTKVGKGPRTAFSKAEHAKMRIVHRVYCPERTEEFSSYVRTRTLANARARQRALEAQQQAAYGY
jgi:hypothetical protein